MEKLKYLPVLMYHNIGEQKKGVSPSNFCLNPAEFELQLDYLLKKNYTSLDFADLEAILSGAKPCPKRPVMLTFDDAYFETLEKVAPLLTSKNLKGIFSVVTDYLGKASTWETENSASLTVSETQIREYQNALISFESHTAGHKNLAQQTPEENLSDLSLSKKRLESVTGKRIRAVFYPYGDYNEKVKAAAAKAGYIFGLAIATTKRTTMEDALEMRRVYIKSSDSFLDFKRKIANWYICFRGFRESVREKRRQV